jgi:DNA-binding SARP family transcriptional activator
VLNGPRGSTGQKYGRSARADAERAAYRALGALQVRDETGRSVHVGGRQLRVLLTLLALNTGRVVPAGSLAGQIWPDDPPGNPGNALQTLVSRLRAALALVASAVANPAQAG